MEKKWYVVHTYSGYENKVMANLERRVQSMAMQDKIFRIVVPTEEEVEIKDDRIKLIDFENNEYEIDFNGIEISEK